MKGLSLDDLANALNVSKRSVCLWEEDKIVPTIENMVGLSRLLDISMDKLCGKEEIGEQPVTEALKPHFIPKDYRNRHENVKKINIKLTDKRYKMFKKILLLLFILSLFSLFIALFLVLKVSGLSEIPNGDSIDDSIMIEHMWLFWCVIPIPLASFILGIYCKIKGMRCMKNIIAGFIFTFLLFVYGSFTMIFAGQISHDYSYVNRIENIIRIDLPDSGLIATDYETANHGTSGISKKESSKVKFTDDKEIKNFEENLLLNSLWKSSIRDFQIGTIDNYDYLLTQNFDYFMLYNNDTNEYNVAPQIGTHEMFYLAYDLDKNLMVIVHYSLFNYL